MTVLRPLAEFLLQPWLILVILILVATCNLWRRRIESRRRLLLLTVPVFLLYAASTPAVRFLAYGSLEWNYPERYDRPSSIDGIVVLGGYVNPPNELRPHANLGTDSLYRSLHALRFYRREACPIVLAGGMMDPKNRGPTVAEAMSDFLAGNGIPEADMIVESQSKSTFENARNCAEILKPLGIRRIVLVTEAIHMRRAEACFLAQGFDVVPSPCMFRASKFGGRIGSFLPSPAAAGDIEAVLHEWVGILFYKWQGWI